MSTEAPRSLRPHVDDDVEVLESRSAGWMFRCHRCDITEVNITEAVAREMARLHAGVGSAPLSEEPAAEDFHAAIEATEAAIARMQTFGSIHAPMIVGHEVTPRERYISDMVNAGIIETGEELAGFVGSADTSGWPGGRGSDVNECQERAAKLAEQPGGDR